MPDIAADSTTADVGTGQPVAQVDVRSQPHVSFNTKAAGPARRYWRSLDELAGDNEFHQRMGIEFAADADQWLDPTTRRNFLRLMGASLALGGVVGCSDFPQEKIVPYVNQPESVVPGVATFYATTVPFGGYGLGAVIESHEGRPTKVEGNPEHPASLGASNIFMQASVLDLYDPDRSKLVTHAGSASTWGSFLQALNQRLDVHGGKGGGLRLLTRALTSPTVAKQIEDFRKRFPEARWHRYDPTDDAGCSARLGGAPGQAVYDFSKADVILSLDADFVINDPGSLAYARQFADRRRRTPGLDPAKQSMNRLYMVESTFSLTGATADHRLAVKPSQVMQIARAIAGRLNAASFREPALSPKWQQFVERVADDLKAGGGRDSLNGRVGVVVAGDHQPRELQALAAAMNHVLGSVGNAVRYIPPVEVQGSADLRSLVSDMTAGKVDTLLILGGNPAYDAPADFEFAKALGHLSTAVDSAGHPANFTVHLGSHDDETSFYCQWHVPEAHYLEAWGDVRAFDGSASIVQPIILPLSNASRSVCEMMTAILGRPDQSAYETVRGHWASEWASTHPSPAPQTQPTQVSTNLLPPKTQKDARDFESWWQLALRMGIVEGSMYPSEEFKAVSPTDSAIAAASEVSHKQWEIVFRPDAGVWDGQFANNPWLQELPRPFTKLVWDNAALISPRSAASLGITDRDVLRVTVAGRKLDAPALIVPGLPDETLTLTLGYGRQKAGHVANEDGVVRGYNAYALRTSSALSVAIADLTTVPGVTSPLVMTRSHHAMDDLPGMHANDERGALRPHAIEHADADEQEIEITNRRLVRSATLAQFKQDPDWVTRLGGDGEMMEKGISTQYPGRKIHLSIYPDKDHGGWDYSKGYQWGMSIDPTACIGCNACMIACQSENNIPVVGKEEVSHQREMHWIRIDDWFGSQPGASTAGALDDPQVVHMPVPCQHCENAPCEVVCPVGATTHSVEGLNEMTYNRCIGTRYCSNNCPYKVRRFNFFLFADYATPTRALQYNPDVTVRSRGVMEKCTFCVQRINRTRMDIEKLTLQLEDRAAKIEAESPEQADTIRGHIPAPQKQLMDQLQTACQQACPTQAIIFGDKNNPESPVSKLKADKLDYTLLADLTTQPRTSYMGRLNNPNPRFDATSADHS